jgi:(p)ppGpp synthase/HD superfamily hydrolase
MLSERIKSAIDFAIVKHQGQLDKAGKPYFGHVLRVALSVASRQDIPDDDDYFISAILHDVVEDAKVSLAEIEEQWGKVVADAVDSVSRQIKHKRKESYMQLIERASQNEIGIVVKMADLEDNSNPERIASLPPDNRDIVKRYDRAKKYLLEVIRVKEEQKVAMSIDGGA